MDRINIDGKWIELDNPMEVPEKLLTGKTYVLDVGVNQDILASYTLYKRVRDLHYFRGPLGTTVMSCTIHLPYGTVLNIHHESA